jgi:hypothetical protein
MPENDYSLEQSDYVTEQSPAFTRRSVLRTAAGAGAAGLVTTATLAATTGPALAAGRRAAPTAAAAAQSREPIVVHVRDLATGEMDIFAGTSQTRRRDRALAAALAQAAR